MTDSKSLRRRFEVVGSSQPGGRGVSLIEMLIALLIFSVGLLAMAALQAYSLKNNTSAYHRSVADSLAYQILDAMRANRAGALKSPSDYQLAIGANAPSGSSRGYVDLVHWRAALDEYLPDGTGAVDCTNSPICVVTVQWNDTRGTAGVGATQQLSVSTSL